MEQPFDGVTITATYYGGNVTERLRKLGPAAFEGIDLRRSAQQFGTVWQGQIAGLFPGATVVTCCYLSQSGTEPMTEIEADPERSPVAHAEIRKIVRELRSALADELVWLVPMNDIDVSRDGAQS